MLFIYFDLIHQQGAAKTKHFRKVTLLPHRDKLIIYPDSVKQQKTCKDVSAVSM